MLACALGIVSISFIPHLPSPLWIVFLLLCFLLASIYKPLRSIAAVALGMSWGIYYATERSAQWIPEAWEGKDIRVAGVIASLPRLNAQSQRFEFTVDEVLNCPALNPSRTACEIDGRLILSWYQNDIVRPGERWHLTVRLNRPHGNANPAGFDYEAWLFQRDIAATGYIRQDGNNRRLAGSDHRELIHQLRYWLRASITALLPDSPHRGLMIALVIGESYQISPQQWQVLSKTGTNHLLVISGLHIGLVAGMAYRLMNWASRLFAPLALATRLPPLAAIVCAVLYSAIAGFGLPTQRATVMVGAVMLGQLTQRKIPTSHIFCLALLTINAVDPLAVWTTGFWLSFGAVTFLLYVFVGRLADDRPLRLGRLLQLAGKSQWVVFIALFPLLGYLIMQVALLSPIVNMIAIPWISLLIVPGVLLASLALLVSDPLAGFILFGTDKLLAVLWQFMQFMAAQNYIWVPPAHSLPAVTLALLATTLLLAPAGFPGRWLGVVLLLPLFKPLQHRLENDEAVITVLDVGQGLAVVVKTSDRGLVFDMGGRFSDRYDLGETVVVPHLRSSAIRRLDYAVISHAENDHSGGADAVISRIPTHNVISGSVQRFISQTRTSRLVRPCVAGESWYWGSVQFQYLHPSTTLPSNENNRSCVLKVTSGDRGILIPGDIEAAVERELIKHWSLSADVLVAPHHGSRTSSSAAFINAVDPTYVVFSSGYNNRFKHPDRAVRQRYQARGIHAYNTARSGPVR
ncbi:MAG: DNA internalization-related competence protein ComEC/Rec2 [Pseudomonadales bacterium]|jgi:competence protein ComEC|nr:DNA internalization-related competence protein ComEC/Rec2 [Pseudomonadales bacterium]MDP7594024.1 DNA internalization-related competence protein ComEC/Rec2 [Pseudomonadales bacterium]